MTVIGQQRKGKWLEQFHTAYYLEKRRKNTVIYFIYNNIVVMFSFFSIEIKHRKNPVIMLLLDYFAVGPNTAQPLL